MRNNCVLGSAVLKKDMIISKFKGHIEFEVAAPIRKLIGRVHFRMMIVICCIALYLGFQRKLMFRGNNSNIFVEK